MFIMSHDHTTAVNSDLIRSLQIVSDQKQYGAEYALIAFTPFCFDKKNTIVCLEASDDVATVRRRMTYLVDKINERPQHIYLDKTEDEWRART